MSKNLLICDLLELYGPLLTAKQSHLLELYYFDDLSLSEIAENEGGSRQGAMDVIKRAEKELLKAEQTPFPTKTPFSEQNVILIKQPHSQTMRKKKRKKKRKEFFFCINYELLDTFYNICFSRKSFKMSN